MDNLGVGIIGAGNISAAYLRLAPLFSGIQMRAIADINMDAADARAEEFSIEAREVDQLLGSDDIDVVVNLTIPSAHFDLTRRILDAGKHAYTEKPIVLSLEEGETLRQMSKASGLRIGSAPDTFLGGANQQARSLIDDGAVGKIVSGTAHVMSRGMEHWHPNPDFFFKPGAGPMLDIGPYYVTNLIQLLGAVESIYASAMSARATREILSQPRFGESIVVETPTTIHAILTFSSGAMITLGTSWDVKAHGHPVMELYGTEGTISLPDPNFFSGELTLANAEGDVEVVEPWDHPFARNNDELESPIPRANYRVAGLADMAAGIRENRSHRCSLELAIHAVEVMTGALRSAELGERVVMTTSCERPEPLRPLDAEALLV
ncbi:MAG: Gfo/Idh/MocA family oxidoreductase [Paracoccaceae bacterium]|nr:Gfo/Idh/MocA family oxidoreductase [Paracoccaceae bacterium]